MFKFISKKPIYNYIYINTIYIYNIYIVYIYSSFRKFYTGYFQKITRIFIKVTLSIRKFLSKSKHLMKIFEF